MMDSEEFAAKARSEVAHLSCTLYANLIRNSDLN